MAASAGSGLLGAAGAMQEGKASSEMYSYKAGMARYNANVARQNRDYELSAGEKDALKYGLAAKNRKGDIIAAQGASGLDVNSGTSVDVRTSQDYITKLDLDQIRQNAARRAYGYETQAYGEDLSAGMYERAGSDAKKGSKMKALASLVSGASSVSSKWSQGRQAGIYG